MNETFEQVLKQNINYIKTVAASLGFNGNEDLIQVGRIALYKAYCNYNPAYGLTLMQYAGMNIKNQMLNYLSNNLRTIRIPYSQLRHELKKDVEEREFNYNMLSTDRTVNNESNMTFGDTLFYDEDVMIDEDKKEALYKALKKLKPKYEKVLCMYYGINQPLEKEYTLEEIGTEFYESSENIRQTIQRAEKKLKEILQPATSTLGRNIYTKTQEEWQS